MKTLYMHGLTMVEVLVALAITAMALLAASQAMQAMLHGVQRQQEVALAQMCADNALSQLRLAQQYPAIGQSASTCEQLGRHMQVLTSVSGTANPSFRRVQVQVLQAPAGSAVLSLSTVMGRY